MHSRLRLNSKHIYFGLPDFCGADSVEVGAGQQAGVSSAPPANPQGTATSSASGTTAPPETKYENPEGKIAALEAEKNRHWQTAQELQTENAALKQFKDEAERKGLSETEALKKDLGDRDARINQLTDANKTLSVKLAFLSDNTYQWVDMDAALKLIDLPDVKVTDTGEITDKRALQAAIKNLAEKSPYLIKSATEQPPGGKPAESTGTPPAGKAGNGETEEQIRARLNKTYPALRHHV